MIWDKNFVYPGCGPEDHKILAPEGRHLPDIPGLIPDNPDNPETKAIEKRREKSFYKI